MAVLNEWEIVPADLEDFPETLVASEVAGILRIPVFRVYELARKGDLPCIKLGRQVRFPKRLLREMLETASPVKSASSQHRA
ncbi:MAG: helix-turn-helix domain-containing protein [Desulfitobacteriaceae bacterium]|nr:helix-turn-helix domain-containing protein [Desulfitobacteriaceae bacterium]